MIKIIGIVVLAAIAAVLLYGKPSHGAEKRRSHYGTPPSVLAPEKTWTALVVRSGDQVFLKEGIKSESVCRELLCYQQWDKSCAAREADVEAEKIAAARREEERKQREAEWRKANPCTINPDGGKTCKTMGGCGSVTVDKDGKTVMGTSGCGIWGGSSSFTITGVYQRVMAAACFQ